MQRLMKKPMPKRVWIQFDKNWHPHGVTRLADEAKGWRDGAKEEGIGDQIMAFVPEPVTRTASKKPKKKSAAKAKKTKK